MNQQPEKRLLLTEVLPAFAAELRQLLVERCRFGDDFCATFYTQPKPQGSFDPGHRDVALAPDERMLCCP
ncbi:MAG: hypothetical protein WB460_00775 [Candidatus Acidiferrales bacterium]